MKNIAILGSTGSIGTQTLEVIKAHPKQFRVIGLSGGTNLTLLREQIKLFSPKIVSVKSKLIADKLKADVPANIKIVYGEEGLIEVATFDEVDFVVSAVVGSIGLKPTIKAIEVGKQIGLANKETLVSGGHIVMELAKKHQVSIIPIDSEHSAIYQSLNGENIKQVKRIILTASGGTFRDKTREELRNVTIEDALKHPNWSMGAKITIDSATMMNKGLEIIEAHWLFNLPFEKIDVLIHPESIIHSMVEFQDLAIIAQLGTPDMKVPIQYALSYPDRIELNSKPLDLTEVGTLNFRKPDYERFPSLKMAYQSGKIGGTMPTVLNAANEAVVEAFLQSRVPFIEIESLIHNVLDQHNSIINPSLEEIIAADLWARNAVKDLIINKGW
ncbi:1-deoxy-D-xylulose-5-phosphate reductoisomerase [Vulcanibacillus modesticaldus]|uniref:1-deoxy-D-xylulose 5-phosphate reductoisomerase n=1 Tax=Vulcanibacillus modesticaldus TaxID=337097 RepID=A0A1D2YXE6_9BACI|nr:1-deoxy-D-xylulose-5-phosphate reductoisomerase [Vulcanibacillus modesticaldus]OEG00435.1 1-deoxy-D-xylulose-5-phosphate reductoisomerase [Vulcanibacillus modesticaldus]